MAYRNYSPANSHLVSKDGTGDFTTIAAAISAASSGQTIFIGPGTYTEDLTLKAGVNLSAFGGDSSLNGTGKVIIIGLNTLSTVGSVAISNIQLQTNANYFLTVSGSAASVVNLDNCYLNCLNFTGISHSSSNANSVINIANSNGNFGANNATLYSKTSVGKMTISYTEMTNSALSAIQSTCSAGSVHLNHCNLEMLILNTGNSTFTSLASNFDTNTGSTTLMTFNSTGTCILADVRISTGGTAAAISVGSGATLFYNVGEIASSSTTGVITGPGAISYSGLSFNGNSLINVTTQNSAGTLKGSQFTAPTAGFLGERITSSVISSAVTSGVVTSLTSITLTPGIWDVAAIASFIPTGASAAGGAIQVSTGTIVNSFTGATIGIDLYQTNFSFSVASGAVPVKRYILTTSSIIYLNVLVLYTGSSCPTNGSISAVRAG